MPQWFYCPNIKGKQAEVAALGVLSSAQKDLFRPIVVLPPKDIFDRVNKRRRNQQEQIAYVAKRLSEVWRYRVVFVDVGLINRERYLASFGTDPLVDAVKFSRQWGVRSCPVFRLADVGVLSDWPTDLLTGQREIAVRITQSDLETPAVSEKLIRVIAEHFTVALSDVTLLFDFGGRNLLAREGFAEAFKFNIDNFPIAMVVGHCVFVNTSIPDRVVWKAGTVKAIPRTEMKLFSLLLEQMATFPCAFRFGDFGVEHPSYEPPNHARASAHLRYSVEGSFLFAKGQGIADKTIRYKAIYEAAELIVGRPEYSGASFSLGDRCIDSLSRKAEPPGDPTYWRYASLVHHFQVVLRELCQLHALPIPDDADIEMPDESQLNFLQLLQEQSR